MPRTIAAAIAVVSVMLLGASMEAHHAFSAEFDADKPITLRGAVTRESTDQSAFLALHRRQGPDQ